MNKEQRFEFDEVASIYNQVRPSYPQQLVKDIQEFAVITPESNILEIGCGTGQATKLLAGLKSSILCLEPGENLFKLAKDNCSSFENVKIENKTFEDWQLESESFQLIFSAQAFHWVKPEIRFKKAAQALVKEGVLALFWNRPQIDQSEFDQSIQTVYNKIVPDLKARLPSTGRSSIEKDWEDQFDDSNLFGTVFMSRYNWQKAYKTEEYIQLMQTQSDHRMLPEEQRSQLFQGLRQKIEELGGVYRVNYVTKAYFAKRSVLTPLQKLI